MCMEKLKEHKKQNSEARQKLAEDIIKKEHEKKKHI